MTPEGRVRTRSGMYMQTESGIYLRSMLDEELLRYCSQYAVTAMEHELAVRLKELLDEKGERKNE